MSPSTANAGGRSEAAGGAQGRAGKMGVVPGVLIQSLNEDDDIATDLLDEVAALAGTELVPEDSDDVVDLVLLWWREDDGDLVDALVDARRQLSDEGVLWLLTPKAGRDGHVEPSDVLEAVPTAGLVQTSTTSVAAESFFKSLGFSAAALSWTTKPPLPVVGIGISSILKTEDGAPKLWKRNAFI